LGSILENLITIALEIGAGRCYNERAYNYIGLSEGVDKCPPNAVISFFLGETARTAQCSDISSDVIPSEVEGSQGITALPMIRENASSAAFGRNSPLMSSRAKSRDLKG